MKSFGGLFFFIIQNFFKLDNSKIILDENFGEL